MFKFKKNETPTTQLVMVEDFMQAYAIINNEKYKGKNKEFKVTSSKAKQKEHVNYEFVNEVIEDKDTYFEFENDTYNDYENEYVNTLRDASDCLNPDHWFDVDRCFEIHSGDEIYKNYIDNNY